MRGSSDGPSVSASSPARRSARSPKKLGVSEATLYLWKRQALIDAGRAEGIKSFEADELAQAHRTIAELEAELEITKAAVALFNGEEPVSPKGGARLPKALSNLGYSRARGLPGRRGLPLVLLRVQVPRAVRPRDPPAALERPHRRHPQALAGHLWDAADPSRPACASRTWSSTRS